MIYLLKSSRSLLLASLILVANTATAQSTLDQPRHSFPAVTYQDSFIVIGGKNEDTHATNRAGFLRSVSLWNESKQQWVVLPELPRPLYGMGAISFENSVYVFGGRSYSKIAPEFVEPATQSWKLFNELVTQPWENFPEEENFLAHTTNNMYVLDPDAKEWRELDIKLPTPRSSYEATQVGKKVYLMGGWKTYGNKIHTSVYEYIPSIDVFDLESGTFVDQNKFKLPTPLRRAFCSVNYKDQVIMAGGMRHTEFVPGGSHNEGLVGEVTMFNPNATDQSVWKELPKLPYRAFSPGCAVIGDNLYVYGGIAPRDDGFFRRENSVHVLDLKNPNTGWVKLNTVLSEAKAFMPSVITKNGDIIVLGGNAKTDRLDKKGEPIFAAVPSVDHIQLAH